MGESESGKVWERECEIAMAKGRERVGETE